MRADLECSNLAFKFLFSYSGLQVFYDPSSQIARHQVNFEKVNTDCMKITGSVNHMISQEKCLVK